MDAGLRYKIDTFHRLKPIRDEIKRLRKDREVIGNTKFYHKMKDQEKLAWDAVSGLTEDHIETIFELAKDVFLTDDELFSCLAD